jgi:hypothetical protein
MRKAIIVLAATAALASCGESDSTATADQDATNVATPAVAPAPYLPSADEQAFYRSMRVRLILDNTECKLADPPIEEALQVGDRYTAYNKAVEGSNGCDNLMENIDSIDLSAIKNDAAVHKLKDALSPCVQAFSARGLAYGAMAKAIDSGDLAPSVAANINGYTSIAEQDFTQCEHGLDETGYTLGLEPRPTPQVAQAAPTNETAPP